MKSLGKRPAGERLERIKASPLWSGDRFRNIHPTIPGLRDPATPMPSITDFLYGGQRRVPRGPLPSLQPIDAWTRRAGQRLARNVAGAFDDAARNRRLSGADGSGMGIARVAVAAGRTQTVSARARAAARDAAARPRDHLARSLRPPRLPDDPRARQIRRAVRHVARSRRASGSLGRSFATHHRTRLVGLVRSAEHGPERHRRAFAAFFRTRH